MLNFLFGDKVVKTTTTQEKTLQTSKKIYSEEDMKQFGLYLGVNFNKLKGKSINEIFTQYKNK